MDTPAPIAFRLRDAYADSFAGGIISIDGQEFDTAVAASQDIDTDDLAEALNVPVHIVIDALDGVPSLIRVGEDEPTEDPKPKAPTKAELIAEAEAAGVDLTGLSTKDDIQAALTAHNDAEGGDNA